MCNRKWAISLLTALASLNVYAAPTIESILSLEEGHLSDPIYGFDGRLYGTVSTDQAIGLWSANTDGSNLQIDEAVFSFNSIESKPDTTPLAVNSRGQLYVGRHHGCPSYTLYPQTSDIAETHWGAIIQYTPWATDPEERIKDITTPRGLPVCPVGNMVFDADDNLYFISEAKHDAAEHAGTKIFRLTPEGDLTVVKAFVSEEDVDDESAVLDGYEPKGLYMSADGQTLFGMNRVGGTGDEFGSKTYYYGTIFKIDLASDNEFSVLRTAQLIEDFGFTRPVFEGLVFLDDHLYYPTTGNPAFGTGDGMLNELDLSLESPTWARAVQFANDSAPMGSIPRSLVLGVDRSLYGITLRGGSDNQGTLYRYEPDTEALTTLHSFKSDGAAGYTPTEMVAGWDGDLYGVSTGGSGNLIFRADPDTSLTAPVIQAFWTETPEVDWVGSTTEVTLNWDVVNPSGTLSDVTCTANGNWVPAINDLEQGSATIFVNDAGTHEYRLTCDNGVAQSERTLRVRATQAAGPLDIVSFTADASSLTQGDTLTIEWQTENAASCQASWGTISGSEVNSGSHRFQPDPGEHTYELTCTGLIGDEQSATPLHVSVEVANPVSASNSGAFGPWLLLPLGLLWLSRRRTGQA